MTLAIETFLAVGANHLWQGALIAGATLLLVSDRKWSAAERTIAWTIAIFAMTILSLSVFAPVVFTPSLQGGGALLEQSAASSAIAGAAPAAKATLHSGGAAQNAVSAFLNIAGAALVAAWIFGALYRLAALAKSLGASASLIRSARPLGAPCPNWPTRIAIAASDRIASPMAMGFARPVILLPERLIENGDSGQLHAVLAHERAHVERGDIAFLLAESVASAILWWSPWVRFALARLRTAREEACDDRAAKGAADPGAYARSLLDSAQRLVPVREEAAMSDRAFAAGAYGRMSAFATRLRRLAAPDYAAPPAARLGVMSACGLFFMLLAAPILALTPRTAIAAESHGQGAALLDASARGDAEKVAALLDAGADADYRLRGDGTALIIASRTGSLPVVDLLLNRGADPNLASPGDGNPLIMAAARGHLRIAERLIAAGADVNGYVPEDETPLINAARTGLLDMTALLVDSGADVNLAVTTQAGERRSPLNMALKGGHQDVADYLAGKGARE